MQMDELRNNNRALSQQWLVAEFLSLEKAVIRLMQQKSGK